MIAPEIVVECVHEAVAVAIGARARRSGHAAVCFAPEDIVGRVDNAVVIVVGRVGDEICAYDHRERRGEGFVAGLSVGGREGDKNISAAAGEERRRDAGGKRSAQHARGSVPRGIAKRIAGCPGNVVRAGERSERGADGI